MQVEAEVIVRGLRLLDIEIGAVPPRRVQQSLALYMVVKMLQHLVNQLLDATRYTFLVVLVMVFELVTFLLEFIKLHQACKGLIEVQYLLTRLVRQLLVRMPDIFWPIADHHKERLDLCYRPYLLLFVLHDIVECIFLQIFRFHVDVDGQVGIDVSFDTGDLRKILPVPSNLLLLFLISLLILILR